MTGMILLHGLLYRLSELTGDTRYGEEADRSTDLFLENAQERSGLFFRAVTGTGVTGLEAS